MQSRGRPSPWHRRKVAAPGAAPAQQAGSSASEPTAAGAGLGAALLAAAAAGHADAVTGLLDAGADIHSKQPDGRTAFHLACAHGHAECVECLVRAGCDIAMRTADGSTGQDLAAAHAQASVLAVLEGPLAQLKAARQAEKKRRRKKQRTMRRVLSAALQRAPSSGLVLEFGVATGHSINYIASQLDTSRLVHGFDSFEGLPERWREGYEAGFFNRNGEMPEVSESVRLYKGWFEQTLPAFLEGQRGRAGAELRIAFVHMDCDIYSSTKCVLDCLAPHLGAQHEPSSRSLS